MLGTRGLRSAGAALAILIWLALAGAANAAPKHWTDYTRPATHTVVSEKAQITMRDGVKLAANIQRPADEGQYPVLVIQTPYNKDGGINSFLGGATSYFAERGYVVVTVDVRGTGSSGGEWDSFGPDEQADGPEVVEWAAKQPWSDGKVGLFGPSYMGLNQLLTAAQRPTHLKAIFPIVPMADSYRDITYSGGQLNVSFIPFWLGLVTAGGVTPTPGTDPASFLDTLMVLASHLQGAVNFQATTTANAATGGDLAYDGDFWKTRSPLEVVDKINVPAFVVGGLHDLFQRGEPLVYERLRQQVPTRLLVGPWTHVEGSTGAGLPRDGVPALNDIALRWFDHWLYGKNTHLGDVPNVTQYFYGDEKYKTQRAWPDPSIDPTREYLRGDGAISSDPPEDGEAPQGFTQEPLTGICTLSTDQWTAGLTQGMHCPANPVDDALGHATYDTAPLKKTMSVSGPILANLWVTTTASDAVVAVRVSDVAPDGTATELTDGWLAGSFRAVDRSRSRYVDGKLLQPWHPFTQDSVKEVPAGEPVRLPVEVFPTNATLKKGHSLRITVDPGDFPHQLPPLPQFANELGGQVQVLTEPGHASYVELPALGDCDGGCSRLPVPNLIRGN